MLDCFSELDPPDPIPNSAVKRLNADDSVGYPCESRSQSGILFQKKTEMVLVIVSVFFCHGFIDLTHSTHSVQLLNTIPNASNCVSSYDH